MKGSSGSRRKRRVFHGSVRALPSIVLTILLLVPHPSAAQTRGVIVGVVSASAGDAPIPGAEVRVVGMDHRASTGDAGRFTLTGLPPGVYELEVSALGWRAAALRGLRVDGDVETEIAVELDPAPLTLGPVVVRLGGYTLDELSTTTPAVLSRRYLDDTPSLGQDVFRTTARLPGVAASEFLAALHVRGAASEELTVRLDGLELIEPFHLQDLGGILALVDEGSLRSATLLPGGLPASFAGPGVAALDLRTRSADPAGSHAELGASLSSGRVQAGGHLGPAADWMVSGRVGYLGLVLSMLEPGFWADPKYYDVFGKVSLDQGRSSRLSVHVLRTGDRLRVEDDGLGLRSTWGSTYAWTTWDLGPAGSVEARTVVSAGRLERMRRGGEELESAAPELAVSDSRAVELLTARQRWGFRPWEALGVEWGWRAGAARAVYDYERLGSASRGEVVTHFGGSTSEIGTHGTVRLRPVSPLSLDLGMRWDRRLPEREARLSPRVGVTLGERTKLRAAWGRHWQPQGLHELDVEDGGRALHVGQGSEQIVVGVEHRFGWDASVRIDAYRRRTSDPRPYPVNLEPNFDLFPEATGDRFFIVPDEGRARGVELMVEGGGFGSLRWAASYVLSSSQDRVRQTWLPRPWDQRHAVSGELSWRSSSDWSATLSGRYHTGWPATAIAVVDSLRHGQLEPADAIAQVNGARLDDYRRIDLRVTRRVSLAGSSLEIFADVFNVLNHTNMRRLLAPPGQTGREDEFMDNYLPRMGSLGLTFRF